MLVRSCGECSGLLTHLCPRECRIEPVVREARRVFALY